MELIWKSAFLTKEVHASVHSRKPRETHPNIKSKSTLQNVLGILIDTVESK